MRAPYFGVAQDTAVKTLKAMLDVIEREWRGLCRDAGMDGRRYQLLRTRFHAWRGPGSRTDYRCGSCSAVR